MVSNRHWRYKYPRCSISWVVAVGVVLGMVSGAAAVGLHSRWLKLFAFAACLIAGVAILYGRVRSTWPWYGYAGGHFWTSYLIVVMAWGLPLGRLEVPVAGRVLATVLAGMVGWAAESLVCIVVDGLFCLLRPPVVRHDGSLCTTCGYSLVGNVSGTCPECGQAFEYVEAEPSAADNQL